MLLQSDYVNNLFVLIGQATTIFVLIKLCSKLINNIGTFYFGSGDLNFKEYGEWAVVTGCTDGIGKAYAEQFGMN